MHCTLPLAFGSNFSGPELATARSSPRPVGARSPSGNRVIFFIKSQLRFFMFDRLICRTAIQLASRRVCYAIVCFLFSLLWNMMNKKILFHFNNSTSAL